MRKRGRVDGNQAALVAYARAFGASWLSLTALGGGAPDGLLGYHGQTFLVEFKTADGTLTPDQDAFIRDWRGSAVHIIRTEAELTKLMHSTVRVPARVFPGRSVSLQSIF